MGGNPGGGRGVLSPPQFCRWGTQYQMSPPRFCSRTIFHRKNTDFNKICWPFFFFFFFLLVRMSESDRRVPLICRLKIVNADGAAEKKSVGVPPPLISFFGSCATMGWRLGKNIMSPPLSPSDFRPCLHVICALPRARSFDNFSHVLVPFCL